MPLLELGEGVFKRSEEPLASFIATHTNSHNVTIIGKGPGVTEIHGVIDLNGWFPDLRHFSHYPEEGVAPGWALCKIKNPGRVYIDDYWCHPPAGTTGLAIQTTDAGLISEVVAWPPRNAPIGGARMSVSMLRDIHIYGEGRGLSIIDQLTAPWSNGQFANHVRIDGGHIATKQTAVALGSDNNNLREIVFSNFHIDVLGSDGEGFRFGGNTHITWYAPGYIEPGSTIKSQGGQFINGPMENFTVVGPWPIHVSR